jgi:hypothetical protein
MYKNLTKHAPNQENLTVKRTSAEIIDEAANQQVGEKMCPYAAAAAGQTAGSSTKKFLPSETTTDAHRSRKDWLNMKTNYASWYTTYTPSSLQQLRQDIGNINTRKCHRTPSTSEDPPGKHLKKLQRKNWYLAGQKIWQTSSPANVLTESGENPDKFEPR